MIFGVRGVGSTKFLGTSPDDSGDLVLVALVFLLYVPTKRYSKSLEAKVYPETKCPEIYHYDSTVSS